MSEPIMGYCWAAWTIRTVGIGHSSPTDGYIAHISAMSGQARIGIQFLSSTSPVAQLAKASDCY